MDSILSLFPSPMWKLIAIGWVGSVILIGLLINGDKVYGWVGSKVIDERDWMVAKLDLMFYDITPDRALRFYTIYLVSVFLLGVVFLWPSLGGGFCFGIFFVVIFWRMPSRTINILHKMRTTKFVHQMVDGLSLMSNAMRSGLNVPQALQLCSDELANPLSQEFILVLSQNKIGTTLEEALGNLAVRMPHDDIEMFTTSVNILKETGGNLAETFETIAYTIRERIKVESKISAMTAQGVFQGIIVVFMPFVLGGLLYAIDPERIGPMFSTVPGWVLLTIMISLQAAGGFMIWKIVQVKV